MMPGNAIAGAALQPARYASLFERDLPTLRGDTGSPLLDAFIHDADADAAPPSAQAIIEADVETRSDIAARLMILTANGTDNGDWPARDKVAVLRGLLFKADDLVLASCDAWELLRHDHSMTAAWRINNKPCYFMTDFASEIVRMVGNAREPRLDPRYKELLETYVAKLKDRFARNNIHTSHEIPSCAAMMSGLGQDPLGWDGFKAYRAGLAKADALKRKWGGALHPLLTEALAASEHTPAIWSEMEDLKTAVLAAPAAERGRMFAEIIEILAQGLGKQLGDDNPWKSVTSLREGLKNESMVFTATQALTVVRELDASCWPTTAGFAKALAAALPSTDEARSLVKKRCDNLAANGRWPAEKKAFAKFVTILGEAVRAPDAAPPAMEDRRREAISAFDAAYDSAMAATREAQATAEKAEAGDALAEMQLLARNIAGPADPLLGGSVTRQKLLRLAARVGRFGPMSDELVAKLARVERALNLTAEQARGLPQDNWRNAQFTQRLDAEGAALAQARSLIARFAEAAPEAIVALDRLEQTAAKAPDAARPSQAWLAAARATAIAPDNAGARALLLDLMRETCFVEDFPPVGMAGFDPWLGYSPEIKRGLIWICAFWPATDVVKPLTALALRAFAPRPGFGIANELLGNACLWSLSQFDDSAALSALARIGARTRYPKVRQRINALFEEAARKAGRPRAEIEEEIPPHHGFAEGVSIFTLAGAAGQVELGLDARGKAQIVWRDAAGKVLRAPSEKMKQADAAGVKTAKVFSREIETEHAVEVKRVERLYRGDRALSFDRWREFYVDHPFIGPMCRRLIWRAGDVTGLWRDGGFEDVSGALHDISQARAKLWHPVESAEAEVAAWRDRIEALEINQPFLQAWRETYRVTDAERATGSYSNRFAGHIVRQHQFMTLARLNDWNCRHRMWQDVTNDEPTFVAFPDFGVYAEYWTAGAGGDDPPVAESTAYLYLTTDRVVFHRLNPGAAPNKPAELRGARLAVDEVPPLAFSEIMRCCDLFVSVASIARDANWLDRGAEAEHPNQWRDQADAYWRQETRADLEANARLRRDVLARALPALRFGDRLTLDARFLNVRGRRGAYRIHLGSGAAFRADGQHICIVPGSASKKLVLPYEGDDILALVLSKALLLLRDDRIDDPVILQQL